MYPQDDMEAVKQTDTEPEVLTGYNEGYTFMVQVHSNSERVWRYVYWNEYDPGPDTSSSPRCIFRTFTDDMRLFWERVVMGGLWIGDRAIPETLKLVYVKNVHVDVTPKLIGKEATADHLRRAALAKLTLEEAKALGLEDLYVEMKLFKFEDDRYDMDLRRMMNDNGAARLAVEVKPPR